MILHGQNPAGAGGGRSGAYRAFAIPAGGYCPSAVAVSASQYPCALVLTHRGGEMQGPLQVTRNSRLFPSSHFYVLYKLDLGPEPSRDSLKPAGGLGAPIWVKIQIVPPVNIPIPAKIV